MADSKHNPNSPEGKASFAAEKVVELEATVKALEARIAALEAAKK